MMTFACHSTCFPSSWFPKDCENNVRIFSFLNKVTLPHRFRNESFSIPFARIVHNFYPHLCNSPKCPCTQCAWLRFEPRTYFVDNVPTHFVSSVLGHNPTTQVATLCPDLYFSLFLRRRTFEDRDGFSAECGGAKKVRNAAKWEGGAEAKGASARGGNKQQAVGKKTCFRSCKRRKNLCLKKKFLLMEIFENFRSIIEIIPEESYIFEHDNVGESRFAIFACVHIHFFLKLKTV